jgi:hypothetical protein
MVAEIVNFRLAGASFPPPQAAKPGNQAFPEQQDSS